MTMPLSTATPKRAMNPTAPEAEGESCHRPLLVLELPAPGNVVSGRKFHLRLDGVLGIGDETADVAPRHVALHDNPAGPVFPGDLGRPFLGVDPPQLPDGYPRPPVGGDQDVADLLHVVAQILGKPEGDGETPLPLEELRNRLASHHD